MANAVECGFEKAR